MFLNNIGAYLWLCVSLSSMISFGWFLYTVGLKDGNKKGRYQGYAEGMERGTAQVWTEIGKAIECNSSVRIYFKSNAETYLTQEYKLVPVEKEKDKDGGPQDCAVDRVLKKNTRKPWTTATRKVRRRS